MRELKPPTQVDVAAQFVIDTQKETITELKTEKKKLEEKLETVTAEKTELQKQLEKSNEAPRKPTGLQGIVQDIISDPEKMNSAASTVATILAGVKDLFSKAPGAAQIEGTPQAQANGGAAHVLDQWLATQPEEVRTKFVELVNNLMRYRDADQLKYILVELNNQTLRPTGSG